MRTFSAGFIAQKNANYAKPFLVGTLASSLGTVRITDKGAKKLPDIDGNDYEAIVTSWGTLGASLSGFGESFATPSTTIELLNAREIGPGRDRRFSSYLPRFLSSINVELYWVFQNPDDAFDFYFEYALKGNATRATWDYDSVSLEVVSFAERIMNRDLLEVLDDPDSPDPAIHRTLPIAVNTAEKLPAWICGSDRSIFAVAEDIRPATLDILFDNIYYRGTEIVEVETSAGNFPPEP